MSPTLRPATRPIPPSSITRRRFVCGTAGAAVATGLGLGAGSGARAAESGPATSSSPAAAPVPMPKSPQRPNIVFVFSDEHRWCSLPFTEMPEVHAPNMVRLAQEGTRFDNCTATAPVCTPYRAILMTGQWPHQSTYYSNDTFVNGDVIGVTSPTIAQIFKQGGYKTGYVGKWHLKEETVYQAGFDYFKHWLYGDDHWNTQVRDVPSKEEYSTYTQYNAVGMTDQALEFIDQSAGGEDPFLLMLSLNPPHFRWDDSPEEFYNLYPPEKLPFRPNMTDDRVRQGKMFENYRHYHGHISAVDRELGRVMDALREKGLAENTVIIYTSDHGSSFGSQGVHNKANPFEESVHVPFLVSWPGHIPAGAISDVNLGTMDLLPTMCGLAGVPVPEHCTGLDFSKVFQGQAGPDPESQFITITNFERNYFASRLIPGQRHDVAAFREVRGKRYSYAVDSLGPWFLYDNLADPFQLKNLLDDPALADARRQMESDLIAWMAKAEDPWLPEDMRALPVHEKIARQNESLTLLNHQKEWTAYKAQALAPWLQKAPAEKNAALTALGERLFDASFFGLYLACQHELAGKKRGTNLPKEDLEQRLASLEKEYQARLEAEAKAILEA